MKYLLVLIMTIYISQAFRLGNQTVNIITADKYWELQIASKFYGSHIIKEDMRRYYIQVNEYQRVRGLTLETTTITPKPRLDPFNMNTNKQGGSAGDSTWETHKAGLEQMIHDLKESGHDSKPHDNTGSGGGKSNKILLT